MTTEHSITRHPLRSEMTAEEWDKMREDVQYVRISWPISIADDLSEVESGEHDQ